MSASSSKAADCRMHLCRDDGYHSGAQQAELPAAPLPWDLGKYSWGSGGGVCRAGSSGSPCGTQGAASQMEEQEAAQSSLSKGWDKGEDKSSRSHTIWSWQEWSHYPFICFLFSRHPEKVGEVPWGKAGIRRRVSTLLLTLRTILPATTGAWSRAHKLTGSLS